MFMNITINGGPSITMSTVSIAEMRAIEKETSAKYGLLVVLGNQQVDRIITEGDTQDARVIAEGTTQVGLVSDEGALEVAQIRAVGDIQDTRVENEGDTQVARVMAQADEADDYRGWADAHARTSNSWANAPINTDVISFTWDDLNNTMIETPIVGARSSYHWEEQAKILAAGMTPQGVWDSVDCSLPPTPTPPPFELANGYFYIIGSVTGDTTSCPDLSEGDWVVWSGDLTGDATVEGAWEVINWTFDWSAITGVPENVYNALSKSGGVMTQPASVSYDASAPGANDYIARSYIDALAVLFMPVNAAIPFTAVPRTTAAQGTEASELTRKDYVDTKLSTTGGTMSGDLIFPTGASEIRLGNNVDINVEDTLGISYSGLYMSTDDDLIFGVAAYPIKIQGVGNLKYNDNIVWDENNMGAGSGLDADLLDGKQGSEYIADSDFRKEFSAGDDLNNAMFTDPTVQWFTIITDVVNSLINKPGELAGEAFLTYIGGDDHGTQIMFGGTSDTGVIWTRYKTTSSWDSWFKHGAMAFDGTTLAITL